jgi:hypothetical protein
MLAIGQVETSSLKCFKLASEKNRKLQSTIIAKGKAGPVDPARSVLPLFSPPAPRLRFIGLTRGRKEVNA